MVEPSGPAKRLVLGSGSPRRQALLRRLGVPFDVRVADVDERALWTGDVVDSARRSASAKHRALLGTCAPGECLLTADTLVAVGGEVLGKPTDRDDARQMLRTCSARPLQIVTALCFGALGAPPLEHAVETTVHLAELSDGWIEDYLRTGVALDKAGALELQGAASGFVERLEGCWSNVVGLPICAVAELVDLDPRGSHRVERCRGAACGAGDGQ